MPITQLGSVAAFLALIAPASLAAMQPESQLTWDNIRQRLISEEQDGFCGVVLLVEDGEIVLHEGYGMANKERGIPCSEGTLFGIGSTPIDFTHAAILLLEERGKLSTNDPITKYFENVPDDKRTITIEHLRTARSGLRDFHGRPTDADPDLFWIDRDEMVRRVMEQKLLFAPGQDEAHSHSAWGLLAAIVEIASGRSYQDFVIEELFGPAGMDKTGFYNDDRFTDDEVAIGYGGRPFGEINSPLHWPPTSWLVMGSGGMISRPLDIYKWNRALREGRLLNDRSLDRYWSPRGSLLGGGSMHGFEIAYTEGPGSMFIVCMNSADRMVAYRDLVRDLGGLMARSNGPPFTLGVEMDISPNGVEVTGVRPGGAAEAAGLRPGDVLLEAGGEPLAGRPLRVLDPYLRSGEPITFIVRRAGERREVIVTPRPR